MSKLAILGLVIFSLILSGGGAILGIPRVQAYLQANEHEKRGDNYFNQKQYGEALSAYKLSKERFSDKTIDDKISLSNQLSQDEEHYNKGNYAIEQGSWDTAVKELSLVSQKSESYNAVSKLVSYAIEKLNTDAKKEEILGEKTETGKILVNEGEEVPSVPSPVQTESIPVDYERQPIYHPPSPAQTESVLVDPNPIVDCYRDKCGTKKITKSACDAVVCCKIKNDVYKWTANVHECLSLMFENISVPETKPSIIIESLDKSKTLEAERKTREAESCQRQTETYSRCTDDFNKSMGDYTNCQKRNSDATQKYENETQKYSNCIGNHNDKLEEYNEVEWEYSQKMEKLKQEQVMKGILGSGVGAKAIQDLTDYYERKFSILKNSIEIVCVESSPPIPEYCNKPTNSCTKPYCP